MTASKKVEFELRLGGDVVVQEAVLRVYRVTAADPERIEKRVEDRQGRRCHRWRRTASSTPSRTPLGETS